MPLPWVCTAIPFISTAKPTWGHLPPTLVLDFRGRCGPTVMVTLAWSAAKPSLKVSAKKNAEWRATLRLRVKQAGKEHRLGRRLGPPDCLAGTDQLGEIERFGRYGDRGFHAPLRAGISSAHRTSSNRAAALRGKPNPGSPPRPRRGKVETRGAPSGHLIRTAGDLSIMREENMPPQGHFDTPNQWRFTVKPVGSPMSVTSRLSP